jgi:hypothetical protein
MRIRVDELLPLVELPSSIITKLWNISNSQKYQNILYHTLIAHQYSYETNRLSFSECTSSNSLRRYDK